jgi:hypothetical protein
LLLVALAPAALAFTEAEKRGILHHLFNIEQFGYGNRRAASGLGAANFLPRGGVGCGHFCAATGAGNFDGH